MNRTGLILLAAIASLAILTSDGKAGDRPNRVAQRHARTIPWHASYYHTATGAPVGLVVPPTARMQTKMGWGVSGSEMVPIYHQFSRAYPGDYGGPSMDFYATPNWPSHTDQFGVHYIRGPW
jgi:hypothetical protein